LKIALNTLSERVDRRKTCASHSSLRSPSLRLTFDVTAPSSPTQRASFSPTLHSPSREGSASGHRGSSRARARRPLRSLRRGARWPPAPRRACTASGGLWRSLPPRSAALPTKAQRSTPASSPACARRARLRSPPASRSVASRRSTPCCAQRRAVPRRRMGPPQSCRPAWRTAPSPPPPGVPVSSEAESRRRRCGARLRPWGAPVRWGGAGPGAARAGFRAPPPFS
jgi:hypothetical protein